MKAKIKFILSFGMLILALIMAIAGNGSFERISIFIAMAFAFLGDMCLLYYGKDKNDSTRKVFFIGMISFAIAHIWYTISYVSRLNQLEWAHIPFGMVIGACLAIIIINITVEIIKESSHWYDRKIFSYCIIYASVLAIAMVFIYGYAYGKNGGIVIIPPVGITLFLISDCLIAIRELLGKDSIALQRWIWILYVTGQTMLIIG